MKYRDLLINIKKNNVPESLFSINQGLKPNAYILLKNYAKWEFFFLDEKGSRIDAQTFYDDDKAFDYLWEKLSFEIKYPPSTPPDSLGIFP